MAPHVLQLELHSLVGHVRAIEWLGDQAVEACASPTKFGEEPPEGG